ncbi:L10-interacting MYB domain-containing-like protein isoform X2 [Cinnamomum micranthum f. kanehirae]|uniref:L10-interacting MYB domain-containing-like protein isoform X2 n=1 Tax=Cinnamomum micranthum f. kanehirae TaxID=337451 RepID=A0A443N3K4_9MAGN|nr:L10-interacting MYB domain-containing-like protein isoform X2 [Cinnamomum micranthum f. kanehirae]
MDNEICGEDVECINVGKSSGKKYGRREKKNTTWMESADEYLVDILIEQINLGRNDRTGWTTKRWREIERKMKEKYGRECVKDKIKNRLRTLKHNYNHIKTLMGLSGFGWDDVTKKVTASDQVWDDYITDRTALVPLMSLIFQHGYQLKINNDIDVEKRSPRTDELYECHRRERIFIEDEDNDDRSDETNNEEFDSQYAYRLQDAMALEMWDANANRRAR